MATRREPQRSSSSPVSGSNSATRSPASDPNDSSVRVQPNSACMGLINIDAAMFAKFQPTPTAKNAAVSVRHPAAHSPIRVAGLASLGYPLSAFMSAEPVAMLLCIVERLSSLHDDHPDSWIIGSGQEYLTQPFEGSERERVTMLRTIDGDGHFFL